jgi:hypothetical protein
MNDNELIKLAAKLLSFYNPSEKNEQSYFITRSDLVELLPENIERRFVLKIIKIARFQESAKKINKRKQRGYWVINPTAAPDVSKLIMPGKQEIKYNESDKDQKSRLYLFDRSAALQYVIDHWYELNKYMTPEIVAEYNKNKFDSSCSSTKKNRAIEQAGFVETLTMFEENRQIPKGRAGKNERMGTVDINKALGRY